MTKRRKVRHPRRQAQAKPRKIQVVEYEITDEPIHDRHYQTLPSHVKDTLEQLYYEAQQQPRKAIPKLLKLVKKYPNVPKLYNHLSVAYSHAGQLDKAKAVALKNYQRNPDYLFARINYAQICLAEGDYKKVAEIFEHKFDLKMLYPSRKRFHISEVASFMGLIGAYFFEIGEREAAENYYEILQQIAPHYPMTRALRRKLFPNFLRRLWHRLTGR
jgi:tetratricopeptide (TPR) repeat protein